MERVLKSRGPIYGRALAVTGSGEGPVSDSPPARRLRITTTAIATSPTTSSPPSEPPIALPSTARLTVAAGGDATVDGHPAISASVFVVMPALSMIDMCEA